MKIKSLTFQYFNREQNLYIRAEGENLIPKFDRVIELGKGERIHVGENEFGVVNFGLWCDDEKKRPGHGGYWSSRESIVGPLIGKRLVHVAINSIAASMTVEALEAIIPDDYLIVSIDGRGEKGKTETTYVIQREDGKNTETPYREIISGLTPSYRLG
jgi:hypothetical protein